MKALIKRILYALLYHYSLLIVDVFYGSIWNFRDKTIKKHSRIKEKIYYSYLSHYNAWIGLGAKFDSIPTFPHGLHGIFISHNAHIGKNLVIFHQVTIGSNNLVDSKNVGSPKIGDNCYIGCGAKIIGNVTVGRNCRIGANAIVTKDLPSDTLCIMRGAENILKQNMINDFLPIKFK